MPGTSRSPVSPFWSREFPGPDGHGVSLPLHQCSSCWVGHSQSWTAAVGVMWTTFVSVNTFLIQAEMVSKNPIRLPRLLTPKHLGRSSTGVWVLLYTFQDQTRSLNRPFVYKGLWQPPYQKLAVFVTSGYQYWKTWWKSCQANIHPRVCLVWKIIVHGLQDDTATVTLSQWKASLVSILALALAWVNVLFLCKSQLASYAFPLLYLLAPPGWIMSLVQRLKKRDWVMEPRDTKDLEKAFDQLITGGNDGEHQEQLQDLTAQPMDFIGQGDTWYMSFLNASYILVDWFLHNFILYTSSLECADIAITWPVLFSNHPGCTCIAIKKAPPSLQKEKKKEKKILSLIFLFLLCILCFLFLLFLLLSFSVLLSYHVLFQAFSSLSATHIHEAMVTAGIEPSHTVTGIPSNSQPSIRLALITLEATWWMLLLKIPQNPQISPAHQTVAGRFLVSSPGGIDPDAGRLLKEMPVSKFNILLKNYAQHRYINDAKRQFELGNKFCLAKLEYRTKKTLWRPST